MATELAAANLGMDRMPLDSSVLFSTDPADLGTRPPKARSRTCLVHVTSLWTRPFIRYISHPDPEANLPFLEPWLNKRNCG